MLGQLVAIRGQLDELKARAVVGSWWQETYSRDVIATGNSIIATTKAIIKAHRKLKAEEEVQRRAREALVRMRREAIRNLPPMKSSISL